ncbi:hypothetical protein EVAR_29201_1, partial [Eumeta japonica]
MDKVDAILEKVEQDWHISSYIITEELRKDRKTLLTHLKKNLDIQKTLYLEYGPEVTASAVTFRPDGDRGYLEGLASRYADLFSTHYGDVLDHLEELRRHEWDEMSPRMRVLGGPATPQTPPAASPGSLALNNLTTSHSQPIYVPGKYSPSSCLTDKEEDEIYGFGYGVFGKQMLQRQQQHKQLLAQSTQQLVHNQHHNYQ